MLFRILQVKTFFKREAEAPIISRQSANEGGKVVSPKQRGGAFISRTYSKYLFLSEAETLPEPQCSWKD